MILDLMKELFKETMRALPIGSTEYKHEKLTNFSWKDKKYRVKFTVEEIDIE